MASPAYELKRVTSGCGAEISGLDLAQPLADDVVHSLTGLLAEHCVLFFRDQQLSPQAHKTFAARFGDLHLHPAWPRLVAGHPEVMEIYADAHSTRIAGEDWHSDVSCDAEPPLGTVLYMLEVPSIGGDTLFANMYAAFEALSPPMRSLLEGLSAVHDGQSVYPGRYDGSDDAGKQYPCHTHPVVRTHPVSGRQALFVNRIFTTRIEQLSEAESSALLAMLFQHIERPEFQCRFQWRPGSVAFWDNRCAQHLALWDYYPERRVGHRVTIKGDVPCYRPGCAHD